MPARPTGRGRTLILVLVQCALVLALIEVGLRLARGYFKGLDRLLYMPDVSTRYDEVGSLQELLDHSLLGFRPFKGSSGFVLNSRGLRTPEYETEKSPATHRVVVLGDSFAYASGGTPFGFHWPYLTGQGLDDHLAAEVEVINLGAPGVGPAFYYRMWQLEGAALNADQVVVSLFVGNDLTDERGPKDSSLGEQGVATRIARWSLTVRAARALSRLRGLEESSAVEITAVDSAEPDPELGEAEARGGYEVMVYRERFNPDQASMRPRVYVEDTTNRMRISLLSNQKALQRRVDGIFPILGAIQREVEASGGRFTMMIIPDEYQVNRELRERVYGLIGTRDEDYDLRQPQDRLLEACEGTAMDCLDLLPEFQRASEQTSLYKPRDTHWNLNGNALAARLLVAHLTAGDQGFGTSSEP